MFRSFLLMNISIQVILKSQANITCIPDSEVIGSYDLIIAKYDKWVFSYKPPFDYIGSEAFTFISSRISKEEPDVHIVDSIRIIIDVVSDGFSGKLIGNWDYIQSCGGYDGGCWNNFAGDYLVSFSSDMIYSSFINDTLQESYHYDFINGYRNGEIAIYRIQFDNGYSTFFWFSNNTLKIEEGDYVNEFEKMEE